MPRLILASTSPRRRQLLAQMGLEFDVVPSDFKEELDDSRSPQEVAQQLALGKALAVAKHYPDSVVIGADTIATIDGRQLGKPRNPQEAVAMLKNLSGRSHEVTTGLAVVCMQRGIQRVAAETARLYVRPYDARAVEAYTATGDPLDKAGAYGIQSGAAPLFEYIDGDYDIVIGLPTKLLARLLQELGIASKPVEVTLPIKKKVEGS